MVFTEGKQRELLFFENKEVILVIGENLLKNAIVKANDPIIGHIKSLLLICLHRQRLGFSSSSF